MYLWPEGQQTPEHLVGAPFVHDDPVPALVPRRDLRFLQNGSQRTRRTAAPAIVMVIRPAVAGVFSPAVCSAPFRTTHRSSVASANRAASWSTNTTQAPPRARSRTTAASSSRAATSNPVHASSSTSSSGSPSSACVTAIFCDVPLDSSFIAVPANCSAPNRSSNCVPCDAEIPRIRA